MAPTLFQRLASRGVLLPNGEIAPADIGSHGTAVISRKSIAPPISNQVLALEDEKHEEATSSTPAEMRRLRPALDPLPSNSPVDTVVASGSAASSHSGSVRGRAKGRPKAQRIATDTPTSCSTPRMALVETCQSAPSRVSTVARDETHRIDTQANGIEEASPLEALRQRECPVEAAAGNSVATEQSDMPKKRSPLQKERQAQKKKQRAQENRSASANLAEAVAKKDAFSGAPEARLGSKAAKRPLASNTTDREALTDKEIVKEVGEVKFVAKAAKRPLTCSSSATPAREALTDKDEVKLDTEAVSSAVKRPLASNSLAATDREALTDKDVVKEACDSKPVAKAAKLPSASSNIAPPARESPADLEARPVRKATKRITVSSNSAASNRENPVGVSEDCEAKAATKTAKHASVCSSSSSTTAVRETPRDSLQQGSQDFPPTPVAVQSYAPAPAQIDSAASSSVPSSAVATSSRTRVPAAPRVKADMSLPRNDKTLLAGKDKTQWQSLLHDLFLGAEEEKQETRPAAKVAKAEAERAKAEQAAKAEADRLAAELVAKAEAEAEAMRLAAEAAEKEEEQRLAEVARAEAERVAAEQAAKEEADRLAAELASKAEAAAAAEAEAKRLAAEAEERLAVEAAKVQAEREAAKEAAKAKADRLAAALAAKAEAEARAEREKLEKAEAERLEAEAEARKLAAEEASKMEDQRLAADLAGKAAAEAKAEQAEAGRLAVERSADMDVDTLASNAAKWWQRRLGSPLKEASKDFEHMAAKLAPNAETESLVETETPGDQERLARVDGERLAVERSFKAVAERMVAIGELPTAVAEILPTRNAASELENVTSELATNTENEIRAEAEAQVHAETTNAGMARLEVKAETELTAKADLSRSTDENKAETERLTNEIAEEQETLAVEVAREAAVVAEAAAETQRDRAVAEIIANSEAERSIAEHVGKMEAERVALELAARADAEKITAGAEAKAEQERLAKAEAERLAAELAAKDQAERVAEEVAKAAADRLAEQAVQVEAERLDAEEAAEHDTVKLVELAAKTEAEKIAVEARMEAERIAAEAQAKAEEERLAEAGVERLEAERAAKATEEQRLEIERERQAADARIEQVRLAEEAAERLIAAESAKAEEERLAAVSAAGESDRNSLTTVAAADAEEAPGAGKAEADEVAMEFAANDAEKVAPKVEPESAQEFMAKPESEALGPPTDRIGWIRCGQLWVRIQQRQGLPGAPPPRPAHIQAAIADVQPMLSSPQQKEISLSPSVSTEARGSSVEPSGSVSSSERRNGLTSEALATDDVEVQPEYLSRSADLSESLSSTVDATDQQHTDMPSSDQVRNSVETRQRMQKKTRPSMGRFAMTALSPALKRHRLSASPKPFAPSTPKKEHVPTPRRSAGSPQSLSFSSSTEMCTLCCDDVPSSKAVRLRCHHGWYCVQCMERYVEARLDNGTVLQNCPECQLEVVERDLKRIISDSLMDRLLTRSLEQAVASTQDLRPCPTPNCLMRVALEPEDSGQFKCPECELECCLRCGAQPYHKRLTCEKYAERSRKDRKDSLQQWMEETGAKQCPSCKMGVTKNDLENQNTQISECHKMLCRNCGTCFCFKCLALLTAEYTCGCTIDEHGFVDPFTGKYVGHLKTGRRKENKRGVRRNVTVGD